MKRKNKLGKLWPLLYGLTLTAFTAYVLLDAFVVPRSYAVVESTASPYSSDVQRTESDAEAAASPQPSAVITDTAYSDPNITIEISKYRQNDTTVYVADVVISDLSYLRTAFADDTYGKNITEKTSAIAGEHNAILAVNGDYYGTRSGYVIRNGTLYRDGSSDQEQQDLVIYADGSFETIMEGDVSAQELLDNGAWQVFSFGPALLVDGNISVSEDTEVDKAKTSNPRTAIGIISPLHYVFVVADGRTSSSYGLSLYELAEFMHTLDVQCAYNLDGGGSSTMVFNGSVVNDPTSNGNKITEREVSDIVYIG